MTAPGAGRLGLRFFVIVAEPTDRAGVRAAATEAHLAWLAKLEAQGHLLIAGPFVTEAGPSTGGGLFIIRAGSLAEAEAIAASDPYNAGGYRTFRVLPWRLDQAASELTVALQAQS